MKRGICVLVCILCMISVVGCSNKEEITIPKDIKVVYLVPKQDGKLTKEDLKDYPQVAVVHDNKDLKYVVETVGTPIGIWIDQGAVEKADRDWLLKKPQNSYPVILVGFYDVMNPIPMREQFYRGSIDWDSETLAEGFSFWVLNTSDDPTEAKYLEGIGAMLRLDEILRVTQYYLNL